MEGGRGVSRICNGLISDSLGRLFLVDLFLLDLERLLPRCSVAGAAASCCFFAAR